MPEALRALLRLGPTNPIAVRLVQNGSRRTRHLYIRTMYLGVLILVLLWSLLTSAGGSGALSYRDLALAGASSFTLVAYLQIGLICILAPVFMAGAIAQEASPRTWEVLLTTPMTRSEIVLGNLLGRLFFIIALLLASLPLFALTQFFGGVPGQAIFASYGIAAAAALLVGSTAIALSVSRLVGKRAVFTFYVGVVTSIAITYAVDAWLRARGAGPAGTGVTWMTALNPFLALEALLNPSGYPRAEPTIGAGFFRRWMLERPATSWCVGASLVSLVLIIASTFTVRGGGLAAVAMMSGEGGGGVPWYRRVFGLGGQGAEHRPPRAVWNNPIAWREAAARYATFGRILARWSFVTLGLMFGAGLVVLFHQGTLSAADFQLALMATVWTQLAVITLVAINMSATAISREREDGTLDLLLTTPISPGEYLMGKLRGLIAYLIPMLAVPIGTLLMAGLYVLFDGFGREGGIMKAVSTFTGNAAATVNIPVVWPEAGLILALVSIPFTAFCVMVGLNWSLRSQGTLSSVIATVGIVAAVFSVISLCGWRAASDIQMVGPALASLSPASAVYVLVNSGEASATSLSSMATGQPGLRTAVVIGAMIAAAFYAVVVYALHARMVSTFDATVRKLAGVK
jgi:ABC-type transport system involved in multi-copper enzyme maturation permease subunit